MNSNPVQRLGPKKYIVQYHKEKQSLECCEVLLLNAKQGIQHQYQKALEGIVVPRGVAKDTKTVGHHLQKVRFIRATH